jgi:hypothetical protein
VDVDGQVYGIDGRGEGGIAFAPPSSLGEGKRYEWNVSPKRTNIKTAPTWVIEFINACARRAGRNGQINTQGAFQAGQSLELNKHNESLLHSSFAEGDLNKDSTNTRDANTYEERIADAMMKLLRDAGLDENVHFSGKVSTRGPFGSLYSFVCKGPRKCIHGHCHNGSNNLTLIKRGWVVLYRCFGSECSEKPLVEVGTLSRTHCEMRILQSCIQYLTIQCFLTIARCCPRPNTNVMWISSNATSCNAIEGWLPFLVRYMPLMAGFLPKGKTFDIGTDIAGCQTVPIMCNQFSQATSRGF